MRSTSSSKSAAPYTARAVAWKYPSARWLRGNLGKASRPYRRPDARRSGGHSFSAISSPNSDSHSDSHWHLRVELERILAQDAPPGPLRVLRVELRQDVGQRLSPPLRGEVVQLWRPRGVGGVQELRDRRELQRLPQHLRRPRDVRDRQREIEPDVAVHVREPARLPHERVAVQEHER